MFYKKLKTRVAVLTLLVSFLFNFQVKAGFAAQVTPADRKAFLQAIEATKGPTRPDEISNSLLAIVPPSNFEGEWPDDPVNRQVLHGGTIQWRGVPGKSRVMVAAFMSRSDYENYYRDNLESGQPTYVLAKSLWVTVVPELRNRFYDDVTGSCPPKPKRVLKLLGLNPGRSYDVILEMYVNPRDLFRPAPDAEITDHRAEISVKAANGSWIFPNPFMTYCTEKLFVDGPTRYPVSYQEWFTKNAQDAYDVNIDKGWGVPWTRLGYTYDWAETDNNGHVGLSEFIIRIHPKSPTEKGGKVTVSMVRAIKSYNEPGNPSNWNSYFRCGGGSRDILDDTETDVNPGLTRDGPYLSPEMDN